MSNIQLFTYRVPILETEILWYNRLKHDVIDARVSAPE